MAEKASPKKQSGKTAQAKTKTASALKAKAKKSEAPAKAKPAAKKATPAKKIKTEKPDLTPVITVTHDEVAAKAYEIWVAKGRPIGQDRQNWIEAEKTLEKSKD